MNEVFVALELARERCLGHREAGRSSSRKKYPNRSREAWGPRREMYVWDPTCRNWWVDRRDSPSGSESPKGSQDREEECAQVSLRPSLALLRHLREEGSPGCWSCPAWDGDRRAWRWDREQWSEEARGLEVVLRRAAQGHVHHCSSKSSVQALTLFYWGKNEPGP